MEKKGFGGNKKERRGTGKEAKQAIKADLNSAPSPQAERVEAIALMKQITSEIAQDMAKPEISELYTEFTNQIINRLQQFWILAAEKYEEKRKRKPNSLFNLATSELPEIQSRLDFLESIKWFLASQELQDGKDKRQLVAKTLTSLASTFSTLTYALPTAFSTLNVKDLFPELNDEFSDKKLVIQTGIGASVMQEMVALSEFNLQGLGDLRDNMASIYYDQIKYLAACSEETRAEFEPYQDQQEFMLRMQNYNSIKMASEYSNTANVFKNVMQIRPDTISISNGRMSFAKPLSYPEKLIYLKNFRTNLHSLIEKLTGKTIDEVDTNHPKVENLKNKVEINQSKIGIKLNQLISTYSLPYLHSIQAALISEKSNSNWSVFCLNLGNGLESLLPSDLPDNTKSLLLSSLQIESQRRLYQIVENNESKKDFEDLISESVNYLLATSGSDIKGSQFQIAIANKSLSDISDLKFGNKYTTKYSKLVWDTSNFSRQRWVNLYYELV